MHVHIRRAFPRVRTISLLLRNMAWQDSHMHNVVLHERLVNDLGKV